MPESPYPMISVDEAVAIVLSHVKPLPPVRRPFFEAFGLVLAEDVIAREPLPPFPAAAVDGYAVVSADRTPFRRVIGEQLPGCLGELRVGPGEAVRITTGAPLPLGADAVVMVEHTEMQPNGMVLLQELPAPGGNVRPIGQDLAVGELVVARGVCLGAAEIGLLAAVGQTEVEVHPRPRVAVMSTGDELVEPDAPLGPGQIRDSNRFSLMTAVREAGGEPFDLGRIPDRPDVVQAAIERGLRQADVLLTSGGVSMGQLDLIKPYLAKHGTLHFGRVRARPGKPVTFATVDGVPVFAMPGFPVSALVSFEIYVRPALLKLAGHTRLHRPRRRVTLRHAIRHETGRLEFQRAVVTRHADGTYSAVTTGFQGSGRLLSMRGANALLILPEAEEHFPAGTQLEAILIVPPEEA